MIIQTSTAIASVDAPLGAHCPGLGPISLEDDFCGCTWGEVYYQGEPIVDVEVSLTFNGQTTSTVSFVGFEDQPPFFDITGADLDAKRGDIMTLTVNFAGQTIKHPFRAIPDDQGEQYIPIVIPDTISSEHISQPGYHHALQSDDTYIWSGGSAGLQRFDLDGTNPQAMTLPWVDPTVSALEAGPDNTLWVVGSEGLASYDGAEWVTAPVSLTDSISALAYDATGGQLWLAGKSGQENRLLKKGDEAIWEVERLFDGEIESLEADKAGGLWVSTWGNGVFYLASASSEWIQYTVADGLASDFVYDMVSDLDETGDGSVWFGTRPYLSGSGIRGGLGQFQPATGEWTVYTTEQGLAADGELVGATDNLYAVAISPETGMAWTGADNGIQQQSQSALWLPVAPALQQVHDMVVLSDRVFVAHEGGLTRYNLAEQDTTAPEVQDVQSESGDLISQGENLVLSAVAQVADSGNSPIVIWDWRSDLDGPICTTAGTCQISAFSLQAGQHTISLRVQDTAGNWSEEATTTVTLEALQHTYLPSVLGGMATR
ncbi:MAG: hypothetical protein AAF702_21590 [Chloroflexota bacterium]